MRGRRVVVVGGGLAGITAAIDLRDAGASVTLLESRPRLGGAEAYFARLSRFLALAGHDVTVFTSNAIALEAFWDRRAVCIPASVREEDGVIVRRYGLVRWPGRPGRVPSR